MHIEITPENLLVQLGYHTTEVMMDQMNTIFKNTNNFNNFSKHLLSLNDEIEHLGGFVAMSNSFGHLKIKTENTKEDNLIAFREAISKWSDKYKVDLKKVDGKDTYYIIGQE